MKVKILQPIYSVEASIWDGSYQLPGVLEILNDTVSFKFNDFNKSHIKLQIPFIEIKEVEEYLIYELARGGLRITSKNGHFDLFVLQNVALFKQKVLEELSKLNVQ